jgi:hypothetical protein
MKLRLMHPGKLGLFLFLSLADLFLTWRLLQSSGEMYESNPIAEWWLSCYGWAGLAGFKIGMALAVAILATAISLARPRTGGRVLAFACAALAVVVLYSCYVFWVNDVPVTDLAIVGPWALGPAR